MTALSRANAMQFFGQRTEEAYRCALQFAGHGGHIATMPEIVGLRSRSSINHFSWSTYYTSASAEYFGYTRGGVPIVIVAHGNGPLCHLPGIRDAYRPRTFNSSGRPRDQLGRIEQREFLWLEAGEYGEVTVVPFQELQRAYPEGPGEHLYSNELAADPLLAARFGGNPGTIAEILRLTSIRELQSGLQPPTIQNSMPYRYWRGLDKDELPLANLLSISRAGNISGRDRKRFVGIDIGVHERGNGSRFIGVQQGGTLDSLHQGPELSNLSDMATLLRHPVTGDEPLYGFNLVRQFNGQWFTCPHKEGDSLANYWPEYPVTNLELLPATGTIRTRVDTVFFRYDEAGVLMQAPSEANGYYFDEPQWVGRDEDGTRLYEAVVHFCRVTVDHSHRCITEKELTSDYNMLMSGLDLVEQPNSAFVEV